MYLRYTYFRNPTEPDVLWVRWGISGTPCLLPFSSGPHLTRGVTAQFIIIRSYLYLPACQMLENYSLYENSFCPAAHYTIRIG